MKVALDTTSAYLNQAGSGLYVRMLQTHLPQWAPDNSYFFFHIEQQRDMQDRKTIRNRFDTLYRDLIWANKVVPEIVITSAADVLHMPVNTIPFKKPCPTVVTIHDTTVLKTPHFFPIWQRYFSRILYPYSARNADCVITVSESSRMDIMETFGISGDKVKVTYLAADEAFGIVPYDAKKQIGDKFGIQNFILTVGTIEPRKNLRRLIEALSDIRNAGFEVSWVHAGPRGWLEEGLMEVAMRYQVKEYVRFLGRVSLEDLVELYNAAEVFAYPSLYEGFGLPILEAMACGCPVVTSNISSMPEVAGESAILVEPTEPKDIANAIIRILDDNTLSSHMRCSGLERAGVFSWRRCIEETEEIYKEIRFS